MPIRHPAPISRNLSVMLRSLLIIPSLAAIACTIAGCSDNEIHEVSLSSSEAKQLRSEPDVVHTADDWTCWRGMNGDNTAAGDPPPTNWSEHKNILWKILALAIGTRESRELK